MIQIVVLGTGGGENKVRLTKVIHGYKNTFAGFGQSAGCNRDIACPEGTAWRNEGNSVAMVLLANGQRFCSGSLINNACQDFTPNFLTAFHCLDSDITGNLSTAEQGAVNNWVFRFLYDSPNCGGGDGTTFQSINGSAFRSASQASDFALLLLNTRPSGNVTFAGWSRSNTAATSGATIHHPNGDVKKISIDNDALTNVAVVTNWGGGLTCPANSHWQSVFESGTVQPGSSGSPIFDQNHRIVGQLHGDYLNTNDNYCANLRGHYGRLDVSWNGGGTAATQLSTWLTNDPNVMAVDGIAIPQVVPQSGNGYPIVCNSYVGYNLVNAPSTTTHNVSWTTTANLSITSQGSSSVLLRWTGAQSGVATINANISSTNTAFCNVSRTFSLNVYAGPFNVQDISISGPTGVCNDGYYTYTANVPFGHQPGYTYSWAWPSGWSIYSQSLNQITLYSGNGNYGGQLRVAITNSCGTSQYKARTVYAMSCGSTANFSIFPNPSTNQIVVETNDKELYQISLIDRMGTILTSVTNNAQSGKFLIDVSNYQRGVYFIKIESKITTEVRRIILE